MNKAGIPNQSLADSTRQGRNTPHFAAMGSASTNTLFSMHPPNFESNGSQSPFALEAAQTLCRKSPAVTGMSKEFTSFQISQNGSGTAATTASLGIKGSTPAETKGKSATMNQMKPYLDDKGVTSSSPASPFSMSPPWMKKTQPSWRTLTPSGTLPALERYLPRLRSTEPYHPTKISATTSDSQSMDDCDNSNSEDLASMADCSESYLDDFTETSSLATDYVREGVIAIGVIAPAPPEPLRVQAQNKESKQDQEIVSEVVAKDIAEQEHNLKIKRRESSSDLEERRLSVPLFSRAASDEAAKRKSRQGLTEYVAARPSSMTRLQHASSIKLDEPALTSMASAPIRMVPDHNRETGSQPSDAAATPRLRPWKSGGISPMTTAAGRQDKARAAMGGLELSMPDTPSSVHRLGRALGSMITRRISLPLPGESRDRSNSEDSIESDCKPPSLHSVTSTDSGIALDDKTRNEIIRQSSSHAIVRRLGNLQSDEMTKKSTSLSSPQSMEPASSTAQRRPSEEFTKGDRQGLGHASTPPPLARRTSARPSDDKRSSRISVLPGGAPRTSSRGTRPCDEKAEFRRGGSSSAASRPGAHSIRQAPKNGKDAGLRLASGDSRQPLESENDLPFGPVTTLDVNSDDSEEEQDLEAQAGVPVLLPGAFAVSSREIPNAASGYDSGFEEESVESAQNLQEASRDSQHEESPVILRPDVPDTPVQAELYEEHVVDGLVLLAEDDGNSLKDTSRFPCVKAALVIVLAILTIVISLVVPMSRKEPESISNESGNPALEGWLQLGEGLMGPTNTDNARFGFSISMSGDGNRLAVGLPGADGYGNEEALRGSGSLHIYDFNGTDWRKTFEIAGPGMHAEAGKSIALSYDGRRVAFAAPGWGAVGFIEVYEEGNEGNWTVVGKVPMSDPDDEERFGGSLDLSADGSILAVSDKDADSSNVPDIGKVRVFREMNKTWTLMGNEIEGSNERDFLGRSISLSGDGQRLAASALGADGFAGGVTVFEFDGGSWQPLTSELRGESARENFGSAIALSSDGTTLAIGATGYSPDDGKEVGAGRVRVFRLDDDLERGWVELGDPLEGSSRFDAFGTSVALSKVGDVVAIGGPENDNFGENSGHIKLFQFDGSRWTQLGSEIGAPMTEGGQFGFALAISADARKFAGASPFANFDGFVSDVGEVWVFEAETAE